MPWATNPGGTSGRRLHRPRTRFRPAGTRETAPQDDRRLVERAHYPMGA
jgi:hypothetical protein